MGTTRTAETKSLEKAQTEDKAVEAPVAEATEPTVAPELVSIVVAHYVDKTVLVADAKPGEQFAPGDEVKVAPFVAAHYVRTGLASLA